MREKKGLKGFAAQSRATQWSVHGYHQIARVCQTNSPMGLSNEMNNQGIIFNGIFNWITKFLGLSFFIIEILVVFTLKLFQSTGWLMAFVKPGLERLGHESAKIGDSCC